MLKTIVSLTAVGTQGSIFLNFKDLTFFLRPALKTMPIMIQCKCNVILDILFDSKVVEIVRIV